MVYFRLIEDLPDRSPLGYGLAAGRWNSSGTPLIYACNFSALNFLELLCIKGPVVSTSAWLLVQMEILVDIPSLSVEDLLSDWRVRPYPQATQDFGTYWAKKRISTVLKVPSCRIPISSFPLEHNLLINPLHEAFSTTVKLKSVERISFEMNR